jgi:inorganic pyrophosphatase
MMAVNADILYFRYEVCLHAIMNLPQAFVQDSENINVIIETPKGSSIKYNFDPETELFKLSKILPEGLVFPLDFGFIPHTKAEDGDPLDVLVLLDKACYPGCLMECKVIGVIEAEQSEKEKMVRNDRIIARAKVSVKYSKINSIKDMEPSMIDQVTYFFISYNKLNNKVFKVLAHEGAHKAIDLIKNAIW